MTDRNHWTLVIVALFALGWTLRETAPVSIPIAAAFLSALAVLPVSIAVSRAVPRGGQWLGPFCATAPILLLLLLFLAGISFAGREVIAAAPMLSSRIDEAVASGGRSLLGYSVAKAGIDNLTKWMASDLARQCGPGLRVNAVAPGFFISTQNRAVLIQPDGSYSERAQRVIAKTPMGRFGEAEELNGAIRWLCSDAASFVTGAVIPVDGGFSAFSGV